MNPITNPNPSLVTDTHENWCQKWDWIGLKRLLDRRFILQWPFDKNGKHDFLKAMLAEMKEEMLAKMDANMKSTQETKTNQANAKNDFQNRNRPRGNDDQDGHKPEKDECKSERNQILKSGNEVHS
jgi:hypothetical protein